jgi:hypothetical protein
MAGGGEDCTKTVSHTIVMVEENKRKAKFANPESKKFVITRVDDCIITDGIRCDYLVTKSGVASIFVELKGNDVDHACDQLESTVANELVSKLLEKRLGFVIVCSKYPKIDTTIQRAKNRIAGKYKAILQVHSHEGNYEVEKIAGKPLN